MAADAQVAAENLLHRSVSALESLAICLDTNVQKQSEDSGLTLAGSLVQRQTATVRLFIGILASSREKSNNKRLQDVLMAHRSLEYLPHRHLLLRPRQLYDSLIDEGGNEWSLETGEISKDTSMM